MASSPPLLLLTSLLLFLLSPSAAVTPKPKALVLPVTRDSSTLQYVTHFRQRIPSTLLNLVVDLGGRYTWVYCDKGYVSSSFRPVSCQAPQCRSLKTVTCSQCFQPPKPGCNNNTCGVFPDNSITSVSTSGDLSEDVVSIRTTDGFSSGSAITVPHIVFSCAPNFLLKGLARGANGMAGFGRTPAALPPQFSSALGLANKFAICLPSTGANPGVIFFGEGPYKFLLNTVVSSESLSYTPLYINPRSTSGVSTAGEPSAEYFVKVTSIKMNGKIAPINPKLFGISKRGNGGAKISTVNPYTVLQSSIYRAVTEAFTKATGFRPVAPVAPFKICYDSKNMGSSRVGPPVPTVSLVMENKSEWIIFGSNSMVQVSPDVICLGLLDGGKFPRTFIVIGGHQLEDNFVEFDLAKSRMGFSGTLLFGQSTCSNFNFTSAP